MARQILPIAGAAIGFVVSGGNPMGAQIGYLAGSLIGNAVDPIEMQGNKLGDAPTQTAAEGGARAIVFGKGCIRATVILERGGRRVVKQRQRSGKGGGPVTVNERALWTYAIGLGEAIPNGDILRIWENEKLVYDVTPDSTIVSDSAKFAEGFRFHDGSEDQLPDPAIEAIYSDAADAPYYRGTAYMVFPQRDLTDFSEAVPNYRVEVSSAVNVVRPAVVFAVLTGTNNGIVTRSYDGGYVFGDPVDTGISSHITRIYAANNSVFVFSETTAGRVSHDGGETWIPIAGLVSSGYQVTAVGYSGGYYLLTYFSAGVISRSHDGELFSDVSVSYRTRYSLATSGIVVLAGGTNRSIDYSVDSGASFTATGLPVDGSPSSTSVVSIVHTPYGFFAATTTSERIAYSPTGAGGTWSFLANKPFVGGLGICLGYRDGVIVATSQTNSAFSIDNGATWISGGSTVPPTITDSLIPSNEDGFYIGSGASSGPVASISSGNGVWSDSITNGPASLLAAIDSSEASYVGVPVPLSVIISALHERCGHADTEYDVSELTDLVAGVVIEQTVTGAEAINSIIGSYFADPTDYDGKIRYIKRGKAVVRTLTEDDLIEYPETWQRNNAIEYPSKLHYFAQLSSQGYAPIKATSSRYSKDIAVVGESSVSAPVTFEDSNEPYEIAAKLHKVLWTEAQGEVTWKVSDQQLDLVASDCVGLSFRGQIWRARITGIEDDPGERRLKLRVDRQSAYTANLTAISEPPAPTPPQPSTPSDTILAVLDIPALTDDADELLYYVAMSGSTDTWAGATLQRANGSEFDSVASVTQNAIMGVLQAPITAASPYTTDTTNQIVVRLYTDDELTSITQQQFLSEQNAVAVSWEDSDTQRWELMQFRDAAQDSNGDWILTTLQRGRLNTETAEHPAGSMFVFLDGSVIPVGAQSGWIGTELVHRAVSNGLSPESAAQQTIDYEGNSQREFPAANLLLTRPDPDTVQATAIPRHRFGTEDNPIRSINWDGYSWSVTDGANTTTRTGTNAIESFDVTGWASPVSVTVAQVNRITGEGPSVTEVIQ